MAKSFNKYSYDVFLSFRGEDTRYNFTGNLYHAFRKRGINTFLDDQNLRIGDEISPFLLKAIEESRIFIIVLSENYASSTWCLDELMKILNCMEQNKQLVWPIFYKVDPSDLRHQRNSYGQAMATHEIRFGKDSQKVLNWRYALTKVANLKGDHFRVGYEYESEFIEKIVKKVSDNLSFKGLHIEEHVVGLDSRIEEVISLLDIPSYSMVCMLGIYGIGGIGKTTITIALYNSIAHQFDYATFLFDVRETSNQKGLISLQKTVLSKIFEIEDVKLSSVDEGAFMIKNRLCKKRVLLVLDDVDSEEQLEKLVGKCDWFGSGSRIILTTRDKHLLLAHRIEKTYEMKELNYHEASKLFCWKAFNSSRPPERFVNLSDKVVNYADGLPLALKVIGSNLSGKNLDECECALDQYKRIPNKNIQSILGISYDGLENNQKEIFLDIACFLKGYSLEDVKNTLDACDFGPKYHIGVLVDKSLVTIDKSDYVQMHNLIQDMGREVVREAAPKEPGKRSRLWFHEDIIRVLQENSGTSSIEVIILKSCQQEIQWSGNALKKMKNLRILIIRNAHFSIGPKYLPDNLRFLEWEGYPSTSLPPSFDPKRLIVLNMPHSCLKLGKPFKKFECVSVMDFSYCQFIIEVPDMSGVPALRELNFFGCKNLVKIHDSVGFLTKVSILDLGYCTNLTSLPSGIRMTSLERLKIGRCRSLEHFPEILENMDCLLEIDASMTAIKELPNSIGNLTRLTELRLWMSNLFSIPECLKQLSNLKILDVSYCKNLQQISEIPSSLEIIDAENCTSLTLQSSNVLWSQAIKEVGNVDITMPGEQIPDWFDHRCEGDALSFWVRNKFPVAAFAFTHSKHIGGEIKATPIVGLELFINGVKRNSDSISVYFAYKGCHAYLRDLRTLFGDKARNKIWNYVEWKDLDKYLVHKWNHVELKVEKVPEMSPDIAIIQCGVFVYKQESNMEDVRFECPSSTMSAGTVPSSALNREAIFNVGYGPPKKLMRYHEPGDTQGKFHSPRTRESSTLRLRGCDGDRGCATVRAPATPSSANDTCTDGQFVKSAISKFVFSNKLPLVATLTRENAPSVFESSIKKQLLLFATTNDSEKLIPIFQEAAKFFKGKLIFAHVEMDNEDVGKPVADYFGVTGDAPKVLAYTGNDNGKKFVLDGEVTVGNIKAFGEDFLEDKLKPFFKSDPVPETNDGDVKVVVGNNFDEIVLDESKNVLLEIYSPWCGRCQALEPTYNKLANHLRGIEFIVIAKMDGTTNEHPRAKADGFPTLLFFPAGNESFDPITVDTDRTVKALYKFIKKNASIPFKLQRRCER